MTILPNKPKKNQSKNEKQIRSSSVIQSHSPDTALSGAATHDSLASNSEAATNSSRKIGTKHGFGNKVYNAGCSPQSTKSCLWRDGSVERNSDDENGQGFRDESLDSAFEERLRRVRGLKIKEMQGDGACLFRAVADQVYGDQEMHSDVRRLCLDYMEKNRDHFSQFITEDFEKYIARKRRNDAHGNHIELQAISEIFSRPIEIYDYTTEPKNIFTPTRDSSAHSEPNAPIRLSYHGSVHYNSVIDPRAATIGVGLGLPAYSPGSADRSLIHEAIMKSEAQEIEEAMLKDKMKLTDFQQTEQDLNDEVSRQSYLEYIHRVEAKDAKQNERTCGGTGTKRSAYDADCEPGCSQSPLAKIRSRESSSEITNMSEWEFAAENDADESALLARVMAISQREYLEKQKEKAQLSRGDDDKAGTSKS